MFDIASSFSRAIRQLRRNLSFSITAVSTLAIGIGATTAIFSIFHAVLLRPLPYPEPEQLVSVAPLVSSVGGSVISDELSYPNFRDWRDQARSFDSIAGYHANTAILRPSGGSAARNLQIGVATADFFRVLRVSPALGRGFLRSEEQAGTRVVVLSNALWVSEFHSSPSVVGRSIVLSDELYTVVGVLPEKTSFPFFSPVPIELWTTSAVDATGKNPSTEQRGWSQLSVIARLKPGVHVAQAKSEMDSLIHNMAARYPQSNANQSGAKILSLLDQMVGDIRPAMRILFGAVGALLLIACANVAGLLLARGSSRQTELAVCAALGASRSRITVQLLIESLVLSLLGGAAGVVVAFVTLKGILQFLPKNLPRLDDVAIDVPVLLFAVLVSVITGLLFGLLPARRLSHLNPAMALRDGLRTSTAGRKQHRMHSVLVITETALALVLLVGAGLLIRSFVQLLSTDPGFNPQHVLTFRVGLSDKGYPPARSLQFYDALIARLNALPATKSSTAAFPLPFSGGSMSLNFTIEGHPAKPGNEPDGEADVVEPGYFQTLQIPLLRGRTFSAPDNQETSPLVAVINDALAKRYFPNENAVGKRIKTGFDENEVGSSEKWRTIVGIVSNVKRLSVSEEPKPEYYVPFGQAQISPLYLAMRVSGDPASYALAVTAAVAEIDPQVPVYRIRTMEEGVANSSAQPRFQTLLLTAFAAVALLLAAVGLYAVLSYMVAQRTHEIGLRMALGANRRNVVELVLRRGLGLTVVGIGIGMAASMVFARFLTSLLYGSHPFEPVVFISVASLLLVVSSTACLIPAARAARLDPVKTLRNQ
jgi:predicted permease